jgi:hypothetical protein
MWKSFKEYVIGEGFTPEDLDKAEVVLKRYDNDRIYMTAKDAPPRSGIVKQKSDQNYPPKPRGLWYATGSEWLKYVKYEYQDKMSEYNKIIKLNLDLSRMLIIDTPEKFLAFEQKYVPTINTEELLDRVLWDEVAKQYAGVEISPYFSKFRFHRWYYSWDVASGCIWDFSIIKSFEKIFPQETPVEPNPPDPLAVSDKSEYSSTRKL